MVEPHMTALPLSLKALEQATVHDAQGDAKSLASLLKGQRTLVVVLRHCF